jgi:hypothetical protein
MSSSQHAWQRAAMYGDRAQQATDKETRDFFNRLRDSWIRFANHSQLAEYLKVDAEVTQNRRRPQHLGHNPSTPVT